MQKRTVYVKCTITVSVCQLITIVAVLKLYSFVTLNQRIDMHSARKGLSLNKLELFCRKQRIRRNVETRFLFA